MCIWKHSFTIIVLINRPLPPTHRKLQTEAVGSAREPRFIPAEEVPSRRVARCPRQTQAARGSEEFAKWAKPPKNGWTIAIFYATHHLVFSDVSKFLRSWQKNVAPLWKLAFWCWRLCWWNASSMVFGIDEGCFVSGATQWPSCWLFGVCLEGGCVLGWGRRGDWSKAVKKSKYVRKRYKWAWFVFGLISEA